MNEPDDPGGGKPPPPASFVTVSYDNCMDTEGSFPDTDSSLNHSNSAKRKKVSHKCKQCNKKKRKHLKSPLSNITIDSECQCNSLSESCHPSKDNNDLDTSMPAPSTDPVNLSNTREAHPIVGRFMYQASDAAPYNVHIQKEASSPGENCSIHPVDNDLSITTKLCLQCFRKIISFYHFKLLALKNVLTYLKNQAASLHVNRETDIKNEEDPNNEEELKNEEDSTSEEGLKCDVDLNCEEAPESNEIILNLNIKQEPLIEHDNNDSEYCPSDEETISSLKKIKYEFIPEDSEIQEHTETNDLLKSKTKDSKPQVCRECGKSVKNLKKHKQYHALQNKGERLSCPLCNKTFATYNGRSKHKRIKHLEAKKACQICKKEVQNLSQHIKLMHDASKLRFECGECGRRFVSASALTIHATVHSEERPYACDQCDKRFRLHSNLGLHKKGVHEKVKHYLCQFCSKSFFKLTGLQRHLRIHTKEKPYKCQECSKAFNTASSLKLHTNVHTPQKHPCTVCKKRFAAPQYLRKHMRTHTRVKSFACSFCDLKFHRSDHRKAHEFTAHKTLFKKAK